MPDNPLVEEAPSAVLAPAHREFRGETIYFVVLDRFHSGVEDNLGKNTQLNDPSRQDWKKYWGGDLQGIVDKLDYLQSLGVTALWLTPLFEQVESLSCDAAPVHGYWTRDFKRINARWVNHPDEVRPFERTDTIFDQLIKDLHDRGMKLILDIVCNHSSPGTGEGKGKLYDDGKLIADYENDTECWYHHYGGVEDWNDQWQVFNKELCGLATFNENNIAFRQYIAGAIKLWLDKGIDALRIDTVKHVPLWFWQEFTAEMQTHKPDLFIFGEWIHSHPMLQPSVEFANKSGMSIFDFGLCQAIRDCFGMDHPAGFDLVEAIFVQDGKYQSASELVTFYENHDMPRLQSLGANDQMLYLATALILTCRGVPCLFYGAEQLLHNDTDGGGDPFNRPMMEKWETDSPIFKMIRTLTAERRKNPAIQWGSHWQKFVQKDTYVYLRQYRDSRCLVFLNKGGERDMDAILVQLEDGEYQCILSGRKITVKDGWVAPLKLNAAEALVFSRVGARVEGKAVIHLTANGIHTQPGEYVAVVGDCPELGEWNVGNAHRLEYINANTCFGEIAFNESAGKPIAYKYVIVREGPDQAPYRENRHVRRRPVPESGTLNWQDAWEQ